MGLMDKIKFWKKEEMPPEEGPPEMTPPPMHAPAEQLGMPPAAGITEPPHEVPPAFPQPEAFQHAAQATQPQMSHNQEMQLISSKLDTIKAQLETVLQRLERLEKKEESSPYQQRWRTDI